MTQMLAAVVVTLADKIIFSVYVVGILVALAIAYNERKGQLGIEDVLHCWVPYTFLALLWPMLAAGVIGIGLIVIGGGLIVFIVYCLGMMSYGLGWGSACAFGYLIKGSQRILRWIDSGCKRVLIRNGGKYAK